MFLLLRTSTSLVFIGAMLVSLVVIVASIWWIKDLRKLKKNNKPS